MKKQKSKYFRIILGALLVTLSAALCTGLWARSQQQALSRELIRLHVIAQSDTEEDQQLKLRVRDKTLMWLSPLLDKAENVQDAKEIIKEQLPYLEVAAQREIDKTGLSYGASAVIENERYPTREYEDFALPAGDYVSLKITLGEGEGKNWWCVVFPPLCMAAVSEQEAFSELSEESAELISAQNGEYVLKFRIVEFFENIRG